MNFTDFKFKTQSILIRLSTTYQYLHGKTQNKNSSALPAKKSSAPQAHTVHSNSSIPPSKNSTTLRNS